MATAVSRLHTAATQAIVACIEEKHVLSTARPQPNAMHSLAQTTLLNEQNAESGGEANGGSSIQSTGTRPRHDPPSPAGTGRAAAPALTCLQLSLVRPHPVSTHRPAGRALGSVLSDVCPASRCYHLHCALVSAKR